jgi:CheY-like chemotaxis protein
LLVVDDEESLRITTAAIFENEGYVVDTASSGDEAIDLMSKEDYDLVLTDLHMEGGDGLSFSIRFAAMRRSRFQLC